MCLFAGGNATAQETLFESRQITEPGKFTSGIEGPAVDASGNLYVVNLGRAGTIGKLAPGTSQPQLFATLPGTAPNISIGNGIRFDREGRMYIADYKQHNVFVIEAGQSTPRPYFSSGQFNQPNDLAIASDGTLYASDPLFNERKGRIWRITRGPDGKGRGEIMSSSRPMGTTNGLDLSPDGNTLYVSESNTRRYGRIGSTAANCSTTEWSSSSRSPTPPKWTACAPMSMDGFFWRDHRPAESPLSHLMERWCGKCERSERSRPISPLAAPTARRSS
jgi:DNA-binding beta-propeller fold protein YncE